MIFLVIPLMILVSASAKAQNNFMAAINTNDLEKLINISFTPEMNYAILPATEPASPDLVYKREMISRYIRNSATLINTGTYLQQIKVDPVIPRAKQFSSTKKWSAGFTVQDYINIQWKEKQLSFDSFLSAECEPVSRIDLTPEHLLKCTIAFKF